MSTMDIAVLNEPLLAELRSKKAWHETRPARPLWVCTTTKDHELDTILGRCAVSAGKRVAQLSDGSLWVPSLELELYYRETNQIKQRWKRVVPAKNPPPLWAARVTQNTRVATSQFGVIEVNRGDYILTEFNPYQCAPDDYCIFPASAFNKIFELVEHLNHAAQVFRQLLSLTAQLPVPAPTQVYTATPTNTTTDSSPSDAEHKTSLLDTETASSTPASTQSSLQSSVTDLPATKPLEALTADRAKIRPKRRQQNTKSDESEAKIPENPVAETEEAPKPVSPEPPQQTATKKPPVGGVKLGPAIGFDPAQALKSLRRSGVLNTTEDTEKVVTKTEAETSSSVQTPEPTSAGTTDKQEPVETLSGEKKQGPDVTEVAKSETEKEPVKKTATTQRWSLSMLKPDAESKLFAASASSDTNPPTPPPEGTVKRASTQQPKRWTVHIPTYKK